jgi:hypothetical protein
MKIGDKVVTSDGPGTVVETWESRGKRWVKVVLKGSSFAGPYLASSVTVKTTSTRKKHTPM